MRAFLKPKIESPTARWQTVEAMQRMPRSMVLIRVIGGPTFQVTGARLHTMPPGSRRLSDDELRRIPWDATRHGPDPMAERQTSLLPTPEISP